MSGSATAPWDDAGGQGWWLVRSDDVLATLSPPPGGRVVAARSGPPVVLRRAVVVHAIGRHTGFDVAWCRAVPPEGDEAMAGGPRVADDLQVWRVGSLRPGGVVLGRPGPGALVLAGAGAFERWALEVGDRLAVRGR